MTLSITQIVLFGFSPLFTDLASLASQMGLDVLIISGERNCVDLESLSLPSNSKTVVLPSISVRSLIDLGLHVDHSLGLSFGSPYIFDQDCISFFDGRLLNSHGTPLPEFKGGGGFTWRILQGDMRGSCLLHLVTPEIDEGPIVFRKDFTFTPDHRFPSDFLKTQYEYESRYLIPFISSVLTSADPKSYLESNRYYTSPSEPKTYFPRLLTDIHGAIDWNWNALDIERFICAFSHPYPGAFSRINDTTIRFFDCSLCRSASNHPFVAGIVTYVSSSFIEVAVTDGFLQIQLSDLLPIDFPFTVGMRFHTPFSFLNTSRSARVAYSPQGYRLSSHIDS